MVKESTLRNIKRPSYLMVKCRTWPKDKVKPHRFEAIKNVKIKHAPIRIECDDLYMTNRRSFCIA